MSDPLWNYTKLLMHCDGIEGSTRFIDERHAIVIPGGGLTLSEIQKKFGHSSIYFDGVGIVDGITINESGSAEHYKILSSTDFSLEFFAFPRATANTSPTLFMLGSNTIQSGVSWLTADDTNAPGKFALYVGSVSTTVPTLVSAADIVYETWSHVAITRSAGVLRLFINGVLEASVGNVTNIASFGSNIYLGGRNVSGSQYYGYIDELRLTIGVPRYTSNFTPPAAAFPDYGPSGPRTDPHYDNVVLHCHCDGENNATVFTDQKGHAIARAGASVTSTYCDSGRYKFGASGAVLPNPSAIGCTHPDMDVGADDFTIEGWAAMGNDAAFPLITMIDAAGTGAGLRVTAGGSNSVVIVNGSVVASGLKFFDSMNGTVSVSHFAVCRDGSKLSGYAGGVRKWQVDIGAVAISSNGSIWFGIEPLLGATGATARDIYLDEIRVTKGLARYPKDATTHAVPTEPFPDYAVQKLTGTVRDSAGNPLARVVRSYRRSDGLLIDSATSDAATGAFSLRATDTTPHFVVVHDDVKNALVFDHVVPVI